jgi:hypothetical protein
MLRQHAPKIWRPIHVSRRLAIEVGLGLLVIVAGLLGVVWFMSYARVDAPASQPYALTRPANMPNDGAAYVEYLTGRASQLYALTRPANMPNDGSAYVEYLSRPAAQPYELTRPANMPNDGSAYVEYLSRGQR